VEVKMAKKKAASVVSANRSTVEAMERRGLITPGKSRDPLTIVWRLKKKAN
jgi:hypothetical protein